MAQTTSASLCEQVFKLESCTDAESFYAQVRSGQETALSLLLRDSHEAARSITEAFERLGSHQRRRRLLEILIWPVMDKPALPTSPEALPYFVWQFQVPIVVTLGKPCLNKTNILPSMGLDVDGIGAALVDSAAFKNLSMLACWPSLYRREDFYAHGPLQLTQLMVDLFEAKEVDPLQPLPVMLDPEIPHGRVVTLHLWAGALMPVGTTELLTREPLESPVRQQIAEQVSSFLESHGITVEAVNVLDPQYLVEGYFTRGPAWQAELRETLSQAKVEFEPGSVRLQRPAPGYFELLAEDRSILAPAAVTAMPRVVLDADVSAAVEAAGLKLAGSYGPAIQVSGMTH